MPGFQNGEGPWQLRNESSAGPDSVVSKAGANLRLQKILTTAFCHKFADVDVENIPEAWWTTLGNIDPQRDVLITRGPVDVLDHASAQFSFGSKMGIDATRKWREESAIAACTSHS
jgi:hypothetical protein